MHQAPNVGSASFVSASERTGLIQRFGKQAPCLRQECGAATRFLGILGDTALSQRTEEHLLGDLPLQLERLILRTGLANLEAERFGLARQADITGHTLRCQSPTLSPGAGMRSSRISTLS